MNSGGVEVSALVFKVVSLNPSEGGPSVMTSSRTQEPVNQNGHLAPSAEEVKSGLSVMSVYCTNTYKSGLKVYKSGLLVYRTCLYRPNQGFCDLFDSEQLYLPKMEER